MKEAWATLCEGIVGKKKHHNQPWISTKTLKKYREERRGKTRLIEVVQEQKNSWLSSSTQNAIKKSGAVSGWIRGDMLKILPNMLRRQLHKET